MVRRKVDYIIVGQGIAGSWLAYRLIERGYHILVINEETEHTASLKAAGLYNPITGRKMVKTWMADELFAGLEANYRALEKAIGTKVIHQIPIYRPFKSIEDQNDWDGKLNESGMKEFVESVLRSSMGYPSISDDLGGVVLKKSGYVDLAKLIPAFKNFLLEKNSYLAERFDHQEISFQEEAVSYKEIKCTKIIFCEGTQVANPYWKNLPFKLVRGELIDVECGLKSSHIINKGVFMIPKEGYFTVGSTYDHSVLSFEPQESGILNLKQRFSKLFSAPYRVKEKRAGIRPATFDRKPFIGLHPEKKTLGIFNGFGTKGVSLTPYFATKFVDFLEGKTTIEKEADVQRVY